MMSKKEGKSEEDILKNIYKWGTQADVAKALNINIRRVKYLSHKYGLKKNDKYCVVKCKCQPKHVHFRLFKDVQNHSFSLVK